MEGAIPRAARSLLGCRNAAGLRSEGWRAALRAEPADMRGSSGGTAGLPRGQGAASSFAEGFVGLREGSVPAPLAEIHPGGLGRGLGCRGIVGGTFVLFFCLQHISVFFTELLKEICPSIL